MAGGWRGGGLGLECLPRSYWNGSTSRYRTTFIISDAKARLPELVQRAARGEEITIARNGEPKVALGKLRTTRRPSQAVVEGGFRELPIAFEHAEAVGELPAHHSDPFDRLILAVASVEDLVIVTSDQQFERYGLPLIDARR